MTALMRKIEKEVIGALQRALARERKEKEELKRKIMKLEGKIK